ncbi:MAG: hypothetical protein MUE83_16245, partial [Tabrizicola sp.]|nr:hypothetical protein [Tabrizicola sp.]
MTGTPGTEPATREREMLARHQALSAACEAAFHHLRDAPAEDADALRADLARLHRELSETLRRLANLRWEEEGPAALQADLANILTEVAGTGDTVGLARVADATAALAAGDFDPAGQIFADLAALNMGPADRTARLAFAQGLIAEAALRWADASQHFALAARLDPDLRSL